MGNATSTSSEKPTVVIVGGGFGGTMLAKNLDDDFNVVILERKDYFLFSFAILRATVHPDLAPAVIIPYHNLLKNGLVLTHAQVMEVAPEGVTISGVEHKLKFDYLVMATGATFGFPARVPKWNAKEAYEGYGQFHEELAKVETHFPLLSLSHGRSLKGVIFCCAPLFTHSPTAAPPRPACCPSLCMPDLRGLGQEHCGCGRRCCWS